MSDTRDIVERLRQTFPDIPYHRDQLHRDAADEIERLRAAPPVVPLPADLIDMMTKRLKHERADLVGFTALGNEVGRAAKLDRWIAALEAAAPHPAQEGR